MTVPSVILTAALDRRVTGEDLSVYVFLYTQLDVFTYRPVKHSWLARRIGMLRPNVVRALRRLLAAGYLERGPLDDGLCTYRLVMSPSPVGAAPDDRPDRRVAAR